MKKEVLRFDNVTTKNSQNKNLHSFQATIFESELVNILSFSNCGKSAFFDVLSENLDYVSGKLNINGVDVTENSNSFKKIFCITNQSVLVDNLTIAENLYVVSNKVKKRTLINSKFISKLAQELLDKFLPNVKSNAFVKDISDAEKLIVTLLKSLVEECNIIVIDDILFPFSLLDIDNLTKVLNEFIALGKTIIYFSHKIDAISLFANRLIVMRDGKNIKTYYNGELNNTEIYNLASGIELETPKEHLSHMSSSVVLQINNLHVFPHVENVNLSLNKGEILGLFDIENNSNKEIINLLIGNCKQFFGEILLDNSRYFPSTTEYASQKGIGFISRGLNEKDILENLSFSDNLFLPVIKKTCKYKFIIDNSVLKFIEREYSDAVGIQESDKKKALINFDQYTIQSVLLYRWILHKPKVLACIEPFSNADIFMKQMVSSAFEELTAKGAGIIISSSDLSELSNICDSIIVFSNKRIVGKFSCDNIDEIRTFAINEYEKTH